MSNIASEAIIDEVAFEIERGKIREFTRATYTRDLVHVDAAAAREAGFSAEPATPTHVVVAGHLRDQQRFVDRLGLALELVVVGSVKWTYLRPLVAGDALRGIRRVKSDEQREGKRGGTMRIVTLETEYVDERGEPVVRQQDTIIERGAR